MPKVNTRALNSLALAFVKDKLVLKQIDVYTVVMRHVFKHVQRGLISRNLSVKLQRVTIEGQLKQFLILIF